MSTITDIWLNPLESGPVAIPVLGYRGDLAEYPHDLYSFFLSSIRKMDSDNTRLLWRWLRGMQAEAASIYGKILNLSTLLSPDDVPARFLEYLKSNVGITNDLDSLWGTLTENEQRRLIRWFVIILVKRSTRAGLIEMINLMTNRIILIRDFFDYQWLVSGDGAYDMESAVGFEDLGYDSWMISEMHSAVGLKPDVVELVEIGGIERYQFTVTSAVALLEDSEPPVPSNIRVIYRPTGESIEAVLTSDGDEWIARTPGEFYFGQVAEPYNVDVEEFRVGFDIGPYEFDVLIDDPDASLNTAMVEELLAFARPANERIYVRYYHLLEEFLDFLAWEVDSGTATHDEDNKIVTIGDEAEVSSMRYTEENATTWDNISLTVKMKFNVAEKYYEMRYLYQDDDNFVAVRIEPTTPPAADGATGTLYERVAGIDNVIVDGPFSPCDLEVDYTWRCVCVKVGTNLVHQVYQDENLLVNEDIPCPWDDPSGTIVLVVEDGGEAVVDFVRVHPVPMVSTYIGPR